MAVLVVAGVAGIEQVSNCLASMTTPARASIAAPDIRQSSPILPAIREDRSTSASEESKLLDPLSSRTCLLPHDEVLLAPGIRRFFAYCRFSASPPSGSSAPTKMEAKRAAWSSSSPPPRRSNASFTPFRTEQACFILRRSPGEAALQSSSSFLVLKGIEARFDELANGGDPAVVFAQLSVKDSVGASRPRTGGLPPLSSC